MVIKNSSRISEHSPLLGLDLEELWRADCDGDEHGGEDVEELWGAIQWTFGIFKALVRAQVKAGVKDLFRKAPDRAMVKVWVQAVLKMSTELHPCAVALAAAALVVVREADGEVALHRHRQHHVDRAHQRDLQVGSPVYSVSTI